MAQTRTAVITGAAGGLGVAFCRRLATTGYDLVITDCNASSLTRLANELRAKGVTVRSIVADLSDDKAVQELASSLASDNSIDLLVNNAGFGLVCKFQSVAIERVVAMVQVHCVAALRLSRAILPQMISNGHGAIINVASAGAFLRFPRDAAYIASKSYLVAFTECLALDLIGTGIQTQALCPAWLATDFTSRVDLAASDYKSPIPRWLLSTPESVVARSLQSLASGQRVVVPNMKARLAITVLGSAFGQWLLAHLRKLGFGQKKMPGD